ncbi:MAG: electron transfer flavoprotein subunit alpha/FixB family protein [Actinomycetota bacterium]|nr:electron transfer flavoprotein subunit alpha/FixB family protein [Actinomycetota bacterium]
MKDIFVLLEHRRGEMRDVSVEMLSGAAKLGGSVVAVLLGKDVDEFANKAAGYADKVLYVNDDMFENFNAEAYQKALSALIKEHDPGMILIPNSAQGVDIAPALAVELEAPLVTDITAIEMEGDKPKPTRQYYGGKLDAHMAMKDADVYILTVREATFPADEPSKSGEVVKVDNPVSEEIAYRKFLEYVEPEAGEVDITQSTLLIGVGRGIREDKNLPVAEELAEALGADLAASRAVVDAGWMPSDRQVGISGKTVKPKLYLAIGISGAFQHVTGMKSSEVIMAINKDPDAPIFGIADYGIVDDLFKVVPKLVEKIKELKGA